MAGADRRSGVEERFSNLSEGQRYALTLAVNLVFVGLVIGGFALLYTSGDNARRSEAARQEPAGVETLAAVSEAAVPQSEPPPVFEPEAAPARIDQAALLESGGAPRAEEIAPPAEPEDAPADEPITLASLEPVEEAPDPAGLPAEEVDLDPPADEPLEALALDEPPEEEQETAVLAALEPDAAGAAGTLSDAATFAEPEAAAASTSAPPTPRLRIDPTASLWITAGELASRLQSEFPCSQFLIQPGEGGRPSLRARVGLSDDIDEVRSRVETGFGDQGDVAVGVGCTSVIGGGYVALSDEFGQPLPLAEASLSGAVAAVLPREATCAVIGQVVATQPTLGQRLATGGRAATWVRADGVPALCEQSDAGDWRVVTGFDVVGRTAAALVLGDDVVAVEARQAANLGAAGAPSAALALPETGAAPIAPPPPPPPPQDAEVAPISGPAPRLPPGVEPSPEGYSVTVAFTVDDIGRPLDLSVTGAGMAPVPVVANALETVAASRFPPRAEAYRSQHTVRYASSEFMSLLSRLSVATAPVEAGGAGAQPVWDRMPSDQDYDRVYPRRALDRNVEGRAELSCLVGADGRIDCDAISEEPRGLGFGRAARELSEVMRAGPRMTDGGLAAGQTVTIEFVFRPDD